LGSIAYGYLSDKVFDARRPPANFIFAVVEILALLLIFFGPQNNFSLLLAFAVYGAALSGLIASIGGLFAVDIAPRGATGAAMGLVGIFSYLGAGTQDVISASLISAGIEVVDGTKIYNFDAAILFWIGTSLVSMLLAASLWNTKIRD
jgi:OPA family sugar phosphate sensor protein UhpC-like MFS transporter